MPADYASGPVVVADPAAFTKVNLLKDTTAEVTVRFFVTNAIEKDQVVKLNTTIQPDCFSNDKPIVNIMAELTNGVFGKEILPDF